MLFVLDETLYFPPPHFSEPDGLLAIGGDLSVERLLLAYRQGIFPWYEGDDILWWCPDPRFVLFPEELKINKTVGKLIRNNEFDFTINTAFREVIRNCKRAHRPGQDGTWITDGIEDAFIQLHELGYAHSGEVWKDGSLLGGMYGIRMGNSFFGESMFSKVSNASRYAFIRFAQTLQEDGVKLIDCQVYTEYLESFGARMIPRLEFLSLIAEK